MGTGRLGSGAECSQGSIPLSLICCSLASSASGWVLKSPALGVGAQACMGKGSAQQKSCGQPSHIAYLKKNPMIFHYFLLNPHLLSLLIFSAVVYGSAGGGFQAPSCISDPEN